MKIKELINQLQIYNENMNVVILMPHESEKGTNYYRDIRVGEPVPIDTEKCNKGGYFKVYIVEEADIENTEIMLQLVPQGIDELIPDSSKYLLPHERQKNDS